MMSRNVAFAVAFVAPFSAPVFADTPSQEFYCCQRKDIRAGECARFELTAEQCSTIKARVSTFHTQQMEFGRQINEANRKVAEMLDAIEKNDAPRVHSLLAARKSDPPNLARLPLIPMFLISATRFRHETIVAELLMVGVDVNGGDVDKKLHSCMPARKAILGL